MSPSDIDSSQWGEEVALLVLTYSALERYLPAVRANLDLFWPERPKTFYATDGAISGSDVLNFKHVTFVELLSGAIASLVEANPKITHVILMLEDLCPLASVDNNKLKKAYNVLRAHNKKYLTAQWPVHEGYVWKRDNWRETCGSIIDHGTVLTQIPSGWDAYNSLVVCLWEVSYLKEIISKKIFYKKLDPWSFENPLDNQNEGHYLLEDFWPTYNNGFMWGGELNTKLLTRTHWPKSPLLSEIRCDYSGLDSLTLCQIKRFLWRIARLLRRRSGA